MNNTRLNIICAVQLLTELTKVNSTSIKSSICDLYPAWIYLLNLRNELDTLLSITDLGLGKHLFIKLLEYYKSIDEEGAAYYWNEFDKEDE